MFAFGVKLLNLVYTSKRISTIIMNLSLPAYWQLIFVTDEKWHWKITQVCDAIWTCEWPGSQSKVLIVNSSLDCNAQHNNTLGGFYSYDKCKFQNFLICGPFLKSNLQKQYIHTSIKQLTGNLVHKVSNSVDKSHETVMGFEPVTDLPVHNPKF